jgi:uncharacterized zinc-type alcohol dehydrogenase-like protein
MKGRKLAGSLIGGIRETLEIPNFCVEHNIVCDVEIILINKIHEANNHILRSDEK